MWITAKQAGKDHNRYCKRWIPTHPRKTRKLRLGNSVKQCSKAVPRIAYLIQAHTRPPITPTTVTPWNVVAF
jgi:hypothetical protein